MWYRWRNIVLGRRVPSEPKFVARARMCTRLLAILIIVGYFLYLLSRLFNRKLRLSYVEELELSIPIPDVLFTTYTPVTIACYQYTGSGGVPCSVERVDLESLWSTQFGYAFPGEPQFFVYKNSSARFYSDIEFIAFGVALQGDIVSGTNVDVAVYDQEFSLVRAETFSKLKGRPKEMEGFLKTVQVYNQHSLSKGNNELSIQRNVKEFAWPYWLNTILRWRIDSKFNYLTSRFYPVDPLIGTGNKSMATVVISPGSFLVTREIEEFDMTVFDALASIGGISGLIIGIYIVLLGDRRFNPWGVIPRCCTQNKTKRHFIESYRPNFPFKSDERGLQLDELENKVLAMENFFREYIIDTEVIDECF